MARVRVCVPPPQETVQSLYGVQLSTAQSRGHALPVVLQQQMRRSDVVAAQVVVAADCAKRQDVLDVTKAGLEAEVEEVKALHEEKGGDAMRALAALNAEGEVMSAMAPTLHA